jgi:hypothetical protein
MFWEWVLLIAAVMAAAVGIDVGVRTGDPTAGFKAAFATFVSSAITAGVFSAGLGVVGSIAPGLVDTAKTALSVVGLASGTYGVVEAGRNGMYATAVVGAVLLAVAAYSLFSGGEPKAGKESKKGLAGQQFADSREGLVLSDASYGDDRDASLREFLKVRPPNDDGYLTLGEAEWQWKYGKGQPVTVDATKLELPEIDPGRFKDGQAAVTLPKMRDFVVHGTVTLEPDPANPNFAVIGSDTFNFDMKYPFLDHFMRNVQTLLLRIYVGPGQPFKIHFEGRIPIH